MVGDDDIDGKFSGAAHHFGGADAGIHADDEGDALGGGGFDHFRPHAVAFIQPVGNVVADVAAGQAERGGEQDDGHGAIDIVVAVDEKFFVSLDRRDETRDGFGHVAQRQRVVKLVERGIEKAASVIR
jgi:hypothetical protein